MAQIIRFVQFVFISNCEQNIVQFYNFVENIKTVFDVLFKISCSFRRRLILKTWKFRLISACHRARWTDELVGAGSLPSLFMSTCKHLLSRQARHWLRWVLSTGHLPRAEPCALHEYSRCLCTLRLKNPEQPVAPVNIRRPSASDVHLPSNFTIWLLCQLMRRTYTILMIMIKMIMKMIT